MSKTGVEHEYGGERLLKNAFPGQCSLQFGVMLERRTMEFHGIVRPLGI